MSAISEIEKIMPQHKKTWLLNFILYYRYSDMRMALANRVVDMWQWLGKFVYILSLCANSPFWIRENLFSQPIYVSANLNKKFFNPTNVKINNLQKQTQDIDVVFF